MDDNRKTKTDYKWFFEDFERLKIDLRNTKNQYQSTKIETFYTKIERWINRLITFVWIIDFRPFRDNRFEDKRQSLNGFIMEKESWQIKISLFLNPKRLEIQEESYWFRNIYDSQKDYDSWKDNDWLFKERLKSKDNHPKNWELEDWFWMESWKLEDSLD